MRVQAVVGVMVCAVLVLSEAGGSVPANFVDTIVKTGFDNNGNPNDPYNYGYVLTKIRFLPDGRMMYSTRDCFFWLVASPYSSSLSATKLFKIASCQSPGEMGCVLLGCGALLIRHVHPGFSFLLGALWRWAAVMHASRHPLWCRHLTLSAHWQTAELCAGSQLLYQPYVAVHLRVGGERSLAYASCMPPLHAFRSWLCCGSFAVFCAFGVLRLCRCVT